MKKGFSFYRFFGSIWCTFATYCLALPCAAVVVIIAFLSVTFNASRKVLAFIVRLFSSVFFFFIFVPVRYTVDPVLKETIGKKQYLVVSNHASYYDIPAIMMKVSDIIWIARDKFFKVPLFGTFLKKTGCIPINTGRMRSVKSEMDKGMANLPRTASIVIFPEGTRTLTGALQPLKKGFIQIFRQTGFDIMPVTVNGTYVIKPKKHWWVTPVREVMVAFHAPIPAAEISDKSDEEIIAIVSARIAEGHKSDY